MWLVQPCVKNIVYYNLACLAARAGAFGTPLQAAAPFGQVAGAGGTDENRKAAKGRRK